jgi:hypothetical protein
MIYGRKKHVFISMYVCRYICMCVFIHKKDYIKFGEDIKWENNCQNMKW